MRVAGYSPARVRGLPVKKSPLFGAVADRRRAGLETTCSARKPPALVGATSNQQRKMQVKVTVIAPFSEFTSKAGKVSYRAPCTFNDEGARYPIGRGTVYVSQPTPVGKDGLQLVARLVSYDRGEARFAV